MDSHIVEHYQTAAKVHTLCRKKASDMIQPGVKLLDIAEEIEALTLKHGCGIAFPVNLSLNDIAAHYTPPAKDETIVST
ncbi:MAG: M24 family metallopeptidase [archaeon]